jgi:hypothetical protein
MDTSYADAINELDDMVSQAVVRIRDRLSKEEIVDELRRLAAELEGEE